MNVLGFPRDCCPRPILRAHQMYAYRGPLPASERQVVADYEMQVGGRTSTVKEIVKFYELERFSEQLI